MKRKRKVDMADNNVENQIQNEFDQNSSTPVELNKGIKTEEDKFYRSRLSGLSVLVKAHKQDATLNQVVRFVPYSEKYQGDDVKVGYLKTNVSQVIEILENDPNVEEIQQQEFEKATGKGSRPAGY